MVNKPLIRPYFWGGTLGGGWLISYEINVTKGSSDISHIPNLFFEPQTKQLVFVTLDIQTPKLKRSDWTQKIYQPNTTES